jgi:hypothetical protein
VFRGDPTLVRHLPATRGVERVLGKNYVQFLTGLATRRLLDGEDGGLDLLPLVPNEAALDIPVAERRHKPLVALQRSPRPLALQAHGLLETRLVQRDSSLREHLLRDLDRETVGVVQHKRDVSGEVPARQTLYLRL